MTTDPGAYLRHCHLLERRCCLEDGLSRCRTVGDVWEINNRLDAIDALLDRTQGDDMPGSTAIPMPLTELLMRACADAGRDVAVDCGARARQWLALQTENRLDAAAEAAHDAMFEGDLPEGGIERDLWRNVARSAFGVLPA